MPTPRLLLFLFCTSTLAGSFRTLRLLANSRRSDRSMNTLHKWSEKPLPSWKYEPYSAAAVLIHLLAISVLSVAALNATSNPADFIDTSILNSTNMVVVVWIAEEGSISLVGYILGTLAAFPVASLIRTTVTSAIIRDGVIHGNTFIPWERFSHFSIDRNNGILRLYSAFSPDMPTLMSNPIKSVSLDELGDTLQEYLPVNPENSNRAWYQTKYLLIPTMILVCLPLVIVGWLASHLSRELALFAIALSTGILALLGGHIKSFFAFGRLARENQPS